MAILGLILTMFIFESILATFEASLIFRDIWDSSKNWLEFKIEPPWENIACPIW
jgi:hypothetical protein